MLHNAIPTIYSQVVHQPSGIRRFWFGVSLLSPLRPILRNGNPLLKILGNAFTGERILQRPTPRHLWATAAFVNRILQRDAVAQQGGPCTAKASPYPRFYNYYPKQNLRSIIHRCPQLIRELELELIQTQMTQKPMLRAEVGMRVRCANNASAECKTCIDRLFSKNGRMAGGAGRRTSTSFEAINASSATGIPNLVR